MRRIEYFWFVLELLIGGINATKKIEILEGICNKIRGFWNCHKHACYYLDSSKGGWDYGMDKCQLEAPKGYLGRLAWLRDHLTHSKLINQMKMQDRFSVWIGMRGIKADPVFSGWKWYWNSSEDGYSSRIPRLPYVNRPPDNQYATFDNCMVLNLHGHLVPRDCDQNYASLCEVISNDPSLPGNGPFDLRLLILISVSVCATILFMTILAYYCRNRRVKTPRTRYRISERGSVEENGSHLVPKLGSELFNPENDAELPRSAGGGVRTDEVYPELAYLSTDMMHIDVSHTNTPNIQPEGLHFPISSRST